jgi:hypothetical protein
LAVVRAEVLAATPPAQAASSPVALMFFKEGQQSVLRELAELTAAWNASQLHLGAAHRACHTLADMGLTTAHDRMGKLLELEL